MRAKLYKNKPSKNNTYFYSILFVGQDRPFIVSSLEYEYYVVRDTFLDWADKGDLESWGIFPGTTLMVRRIDYMKDTHPASIEANTRLRELQRQMNAINNPDAPADPADLVRFMEDRENDLKREAEILSLQMISDNVDLYKSKEQYLSKILERKYPFIHKDIMKMWKHLQKQNKQIKQNVLEVA